MGPAGDQAVTALPLILRRAEKKGKKMTPVPAGERLKVRGSLMCE